MPSLISFTRFRHESIAFAPNLDEVAVVHQPIRTGDGALWTSRFRLALNPLKAAGFIASPRRAECDDWPCRESKNY